MKLVTQFEAAARSTTELQGLLRNGESASVSLSKSYARKLVTLDQAAN